MTQVKLDPEYVYKRMVNLKGRGVNKYIHSVFKRSYARISQMWNGGAPNFLEKVNRHAQLLESRQGQSRGNNIKEHSHSTKIVNNKFENLEL